MLRKRLILSSFLLSSCFQVVHLKGEPQGVSAAYQILDKAADKYTKDSFSEDRVLLCRMRMVMGIQGDKVWPIGLEAKLTQLGPHYNDKDDNRPYRLQNLRENMVSYDYQKNKGYIASDFLFDLDVKLFEALDANEKAMVGCEAYSDVKKKLWYKFKPHKVLTAANKQGGNAYLKKNCKHKTCYVEIDEIGRVIYGERLESNFEVDYDKIIETWILLGER